jgi:hypothetical protein
LCVTQQGEGDPVHELRVAINQQGEGGVLSDLFVASDFTPATSFLTLVENPSAEVTSKNFLST